MYRVLRIHSGRSGQFLGTALTDEQVQELIQADMEHMLDYSGGDVTIISLYHWEAVKI